MYFQIYQMQSLSSTLISTKNYLNFQCSNTMYYAVFRNQNSKFRQAGTMLFDISMDYMSIGMQTIIIFRITLLIFHYLRIFKYL